MNSTRYWIRGRILCEAQEEGRVWEVRIGSPILTVPGIEVRALTTVRRVGKPPVKGWGPWLPYQEGSTWSGYMQGTQVETAVVVNRWSRSWEWAVASSGVVQRPYLVLYARYRPRMAAVRAYLFWADEVDRMEAWWPEKGPRQPDWGAIRRFGAMVRMMEV